MRIIYLFLIFCFSFNLNVYALHNKYPEIMPDLDGKEYNQLLSQNPVFMMSSSDEISQIINFGKRNLDWLVHINNMREDKLSFTSRETRRSYPIDAPSIYNEKIIVGNYNNLLLQLPEEMKRVLVENQPFTDDVPLAVEDYLKFGRMVDSVYQSAARWSLLSPWIEYLKENRVSDIRSFYALEKLPFRAEKLRVYSSLQSDVKSQIERWLLGICYNKEKNDATCQDKLSESLYIHNGDATFFYKLYIENAREVYLSFFMIPRSARRNDINWTSKNPQSAVIPFKETSSEVKDFLHNIELEWKWRGWQLSLDYVNSDNVPYIRFVPGETPNVNDLGGNQITLDANQPLTEWDVQWTIRHEFGHVLGFPDCYIEFYDSSIEAIVNYQLDVNNLMCSRKGNLKKTHYDEMKRTYYVN